MRIVECESQVAMTCSAITIVIEELIEKPDLLLCAATGSSPLSLYKAMAIEAQKKPGTFEKMRVMPLDEWIGLATDEGSCDAYLQEYLIEPLGISPERFFQFRPESKKLDEECLRIQEFLKKDGPIDLCILGMGKNGHLGFNEPSEQMESHCHIAQLAAVSRNHAMLEGSKAVPALGLTLGMTDILSSRRILMIISGQGKENAKRAFFSKAVTPQLPASYLWQHDNVDCLVVGN